MDFDLPPDDDPRRSVVREWLANHPDPTAHQLHDAGYVVPHWPAPHGLGADAMHQIVIDDELRRAGVSRPNNPIGIGWAAPTIALAGTEEQKERYLDPIFTGEEFWCQMFSEPDAGSDLAALRARAEPTDGGWRVSGQKVWTSYARHAAWGIALVRTDPDAPRHSGISCMAIAMDAPGVDVRPLRQITGESEFSEVFLDEVFVPEDQLIGGLHQGWAVANTTLTHERGVGFPFKEQVVHEVYLEDLVALASRSGRLGEPAVDDALVDALVLLRILRLHNWRTLSRLARGIEPGPESSLVKLAWTGMTQRLSTAALVVLGDQAPLWPTPGGDLAAGTWQRQWLWSKAAGIAGGTTEVQRTIVAERLLGLPRTPVGQGA